MCRWFESSRPSHQLKTAPLGGCYFDLYFNPTNTSESTISAIEYAASNAQVGITASANDYCFSNTTTCEWFLYLFCVS